MLEGEEFAVVWLNNETGDKLLVGGVWVLDCPRISWLLFIIKMCIDHKFSEWSNHIILYYNIIS